MANYFFVVGIFTHASIIYNFQSYTYYINIDKRDGVAHLTIAFSVSQFVTYVVMSFVFLERHQHIFKQQKRF